MPGLKTQPEKEGRITSRRAMRAREWLGAHDRACLFKDWFYAVAGSPNTLKVCTVGGTPVRRATFDRFPGHETYTMHGKGLSSNYTMDGSTRQRVLGNEQRDADLYRRFRQIYM